VRITALDETVLD
jgi:hypothetical protein